MELHATLHHRGVAHWKQEAVLTATVTQRGFSELSISKAQHRSRVLPCWVLLTSEDTARHVPRCCPLGKDVSSNFVLNKKRGERGYLLMKMPPAPPPPPAPVAGHQKGCSWHLLDSQNRKKEMLRANYSGASAEVKD